MPVTAAKRKKSAEMPDSPPKRATRARTKATDDLTVKPKTTKITATSTKAIAEKKKPIAPPKVNKRKTKTEDEDVEMVETPAVIEQPQLTKVATKKMKQAIAPAKASKCKTRADDEEAEATGEVTVVEEEVAVEQPQAEPVKAKGRQKKAVAAEKEPNPVPDMPKPRVRQSKAATVVDTEAAAPKPTRGRPKKDVVTVPTAPEVEEQTQEMESKPVKKNTRGRTALITSKNVITTASKATAAATKKTVKFQEEEPDKENIPIRKPAPKKSATKPTGMKAKPVRKPAATRGSTRGRKAAQDTQDTDTASNRVSIPLSPKKVGQVAKSDPISSEDELSGEKTPIRALSRSPSKRLMSPIKDIGSVSKLNFNQQTAPWSPAKTMPSSILASPPRRVPPSPFKDALKSSPKKLDLGHSKVQPVLLSSRTPMKAPLLQESPRRGNLESAFKPILASSQTPFKASLLQSPARRPTASPKKVSVFALPQKASKIPDFLEPVATTEQTPTFDLNSRREEKEATIIADDVQSHEYTSVRRHNAKLGTTTCEPISANEAAIFNVDTAENVLDSLVQEAGVTKSSAPENPPKLKTPVFSFVSSAFRRTSIESEGSEDELASPRKGYEVSSARMFGASVKDSRTPIVMPDPREPSNSNVSFTPLADKLSSWTASSPNKQNGVNRSRQARGVFSIGGVDTMGSIDQMSSEIPAMTPAKSSFFDDEMAVRNEQEDQTVDEPVMEQGQDLATFQVSLDSQASEEYGDENAAPTDAEMLRGEQDAQDATLTCTPAKVFTPARAVKQLPREFHTVSKVPLRASAEESPLRVPRQRSRSFGESLAVVKPLAVLEDPEDQEMLDNQPATPVLRATTAPQTPSSSMKLDAETPGRTVRKGIVPDVLKGAVVYVDVHTTEGADASGIFIDLLTQMGARCVKQWSWNPRASIVSPLSESDSPQVLSPEVSVNKVGITHVVYKDGSKRTLEKVRASNGIVLCVGVGWVLDCEREDKWLDEADFAIDTSLVPRGGSRRRKSMEPRALANLNGNLVPAFNEAPAKSMVSPTKEFLTFNTPASRRETFIIEPQQPHDDPSDDPGLGLSTPRVTFADDNMLEDGSSWGSPTTPYYLSKGAALVQRTCPSKKMGGLFPVTGEVDDQPDETIRRRLLEARRKSLQFQSRIKSPLGRTVSYGK
ncbi:hypothetical protein N7G274_007116 [Stereocaulon virgatum]|uniref:BRCT domain-containing protein n=1 Tax=Stereocaulon virgatum TaxID=373712 RepID=A0ABR4A3H2_9LECA